MQQVTNQLNKIKPISNGKRIAMSSGSASQFLAAVVENTRELGDCSFCVVNNFDGLLLAGAWLLKPALMACTFDNDASLIGIKQLCKDLSISSDIILQSFSRPIFKTRAFDIAIVAPNTDTTAKSSSTAAIDAAVGISKVTFALHKTEFRKKLCEKYTGAEICGSLELAAPGSSHYSKNENKTISYDIIKIVTK
ncbi:hypothetical protein ENBRE01_1899 [Enteropsectra breve]|nr:hypothetical protein ENBRE01_1899 [Enteropsectra breve]